MAQSASEKIELPKSFRDDDGLSEGVPTNRLTNCANKKRKRIFEDYPDTARMMRVVAGQASTLNLSQNKKLLTSYQDIKP